MSCPGEVPAAPALSPKPCLAPPLQPVAPAGFLSPQTTGLPQSWFNSCPLWRPSLPLHPASHKNCCSHAPADTPRITCGHPQNHLRTPPESSSHCGQGFLLHPEFSLALPCLDPLSCPTSGFKLQIRSWWAKPVPASCSLSSPAPARRSCVVLAAWASASPCMARVLGTVGTVWHRKIPRCCRILSAVTSLAARQASQYPFG